MPVSSLKVVVIVTFPGVPSLILLVVPASNSGLCLYSVSWGIDSSLTTGLIPTLITLSTGSLVVLYSPSLVSVTLPSFITSVLVLSCSPGVPPVSFLWPASRFSSYSYLVSKGNSFFSTISWVPSFVPSPTKITAFFSFLVTVGSEVSVTFELTIVRVFSCSPFSPFNSLPSSSVAYFHSPFLSDGSFLTSTSNGISSLTFSVPLVLPPILTTLFWPASSVSEVTTFFWSLS